MRFNMETARKFVSDEVLRTAILPQWVTSGTDPEYQAWYLTTLDVMFPTQEIVDRYLTVLGLQDVMRSEVDGNYIRVVPRENSQEG